MSDNEWASLYRHSHITWVPRQYFDHIYHNICKECAHCLHTYKELRAFTWLAPSFPDNVSRAGCARKLASITSTSPQYQTSTNPNLTLFDYVGIHMKRSAQPSHLHITEGEGGKRRSLNIFFMSLRHLNHKWSLLTILAILDNSVKPFKPFRVSWTIIVLDHFRHHSYTIVENCHRQQS